ncbi:hypothetical protein V6N13_097611 [Hibiscus sabdariffa]|uniref:Uncharacterized protein n=2 Tax=Hibiscus sabdariffa TaxID=183260 RepID=A0ABR1ZRN1_9ROSI
MQSDDESMVIDTYCSSASGCKWTSDLDLDYQERSNGMSIVCLFSKYKCRQRTPTISDETIRVDINGYGSFSSSIEFQSSSIAKDEGKHESNTSTSTSTSTDSLL